MQFIIPSFLLIGLLSLSSCATYKNGQTPDDVYFAAEPVFDHYVSFDEKHERVMSDREDRQIRMQINNRRFRSLNDPFCNDPTSFIIRNNHCYCPTNGSIVPFIPGARTVATPLLQPSLSSIGMYNYTERINTGKYTVPVRPSNGSTFFRGATNQNQSRYSPINDNNENSGSRFFQNNSPAPSSGNMSNGGSTRSGRRN